MLSSNYSKLQQIDGRDSPAELLEHSPYSTKIRPIEPTKYVTFLARNNNIITKLEVAVETNVNTPRTDCRQK